jgi:hypothetical protein
MPSIRAPVKNRNIAQAGGQQLSCCPRGPSIGLADHDDQLFSGG